MFKFFKKLLGQESAADEAADSNIQVLIKPAPPQTPRTRPAAQPSLRQPATEFISRAKTPAHRGNVSNGGAQLIQLPLQSIVNALPMELKGRVRTADLNVEVPIPLDKVLTQLATGSVKISFGEIRHAVPSAFSNQPDRDQVLVALPLSEVLAQLNPALLVRRPSQKHVEIPEDIRSPFGDTGEGLIFSVGPGEAAATAQGRAVTPAPAQAPVAQPASRKPMTAPAPARALGNAPAAPQAISTIPFRSVTPTPAPTPVIAPSVAATETISMAPAQVKSTASAAPKTPAGEVTTVNLPLGLVSESWPESLRLEIAQLNLQNTAIAVPMDLLKESLQRGKSFFPWKTLRGWLKPAVSPTVSAHDNTSLELPLKVVAPVFIARQRDLNQAKQKVAIDETIPNLFFGFPQPDTAPAASVSPAPASCAVTKPVDTNYYSLSDRADSAAVTDAEPKRSGPTGTSFIAKCATPNEIVSRASALPGVSGALVALPDGLMVASKLSADLNGDTLAAFLPQIFGKVSQCTNELRMGELNNLNFTVGNVPWKIFRVNAIYFAAFGRAGQPLPTAALAALAAELDHKKQ